MKYIAFTVKGIEDICTSEIKQQNNCTVLDSGDKHIVFEIDDLPDTSKLQTIDDIGILLAKIPAPHSLDLIIDSINQIDLNAAMQLLATVRSTKKSFSITISLVSSKSIPVSTLIEKLVGSITNKYEWEYSERDHTNFDLRVFGNNNYIYVSARLFSESLYHRKYKADSLPGSLRPTIAAAMIRIATQGQQLNIVDNFCGSGTILCEAHIKNCRISGGDINPDSVKTTLKNLSNVGFNKESLIKIQNATKTMWTSNSFDCAVSNLPWDKQIQVESITDLYEGTIHEYNRIVKPGGAIVLLLTKPELMVKLAKKECRGAKVETRKIGYLGQTPTIVNIQKSN